MASISVNKIESYDANYDKKIIFNYSGNQCIANTATIYNSVTNEIVYSNRVTTFALSHMIPADTLTNGVSYYLKITAYYNIGVTEYSITSAASNIFYCLSTPVWSFNNITDNQVIENSSLVLSMLYSQSQNEDVNEFVYVVYNSAHTIYIQSDSLYNASDTFTVSGLEDDGLYYLRAYGTTVNGLYFDTRTSYTNDIAIHISYNSPIIYSPVYLENVVDKGYIKITSNVTSVEGYSIFGNEISYIDSNEADLRDDIISFSKNILFNGEFTLFFKLRNPKFNFKLIELSGLNNSVSVYWRRQIVNNNEMCFAELRGDDSYGYSLYTERITKPDENTIITIKVSYKDNMYGLEVYI